MFHRALALSLLVACGGPSTSTGGNGSQSVTVETYNVYLGFDLTTLLQAQSQDALFSVVTASYQQVQSEFPKRRDAIADEIARTHPDLIGLQEVVTYEVAPLSPPPPGAIANDVTIDFTTEIVGALEARGEHYVVASSVTNATAQLPGMVNGNPSEIRLTDHDVILARRGVEVSNPQGHNYATNLTVTILGQSATFTRGWVSVDVQQGSRSFRFMSTHLETEDAPPIQIAQATELLGNAILGSSTLPTILVGDFNSRADDQTTPTHQMVLHAGFADAWALARPNEPGFTCCQAADLTNPTSMLDQRIDYIWFRGPPAVTNVQTIGDQPDRRQANGLWPSDHAGVFATLTLPQ